MNIGRILPGIAIISGSDFSRNISPLLSKLPILFVFYVMLDDLKGTICQFLTVFLTECFDDCDDMLW